MLLICNMEMIYILPASKYLWVRSTENIKYLCAAFPNSWMVSIFSPDWHSCKIFPMQWSMTLLSVNWEGKRVLHLCERHRITLFPLTVKPAKIPDWTRENHQGFPTSRDSSVDFCTEEQIRTNKSFLSSELRIGLILFELTLANRDFPSREILFLYISISFHVSYLKKNTTETR